MVKMQESATLISQHSVARLTYRMRLAAPKIAGLARPGQFLMLQVRDGTDPLLLRPFSFHRIFPEDGVVEVLYRVVGRGTWLMSQYVPGTRVELTGPLGNGFQAPDEAGGCVVLAAGGIGIAPLFELMVKLTKEPAAPALGPVRLFYGARTREEMLPDEAFDELNITISRCTDDGSLGYRGRVPDLLGETVKKEGLRPCMVYSCGPLAMQYHVARWAVANSVPSQLSLESLMACGLGACLGCALPSTHPEGHAVDRYVHVCKDGPIFPAGAIQWQKIQSLQISPPTFRCI